MRLTIRAADVEIIYEDGRDIPDKKLVTELVQGLTKEVEQLIPEDIPRGQFSLHVSKGEQISFGEFSPNSDGN